jgi:hypothetical protein
MPVLFVARSVRTGKWSSDVGRGKNVYKVGISDGEDPKALAAAGWAGESDWKIVGQQEIEGIEETEAIERLGKKERMLDPNLYPKLKGARGVFSVNPNHVESHIIVGRALAGDSDRIELKLKPADFAAYLIHNATR